MLWMLMSTCTVDSYSPPKGKERKGKERKERKERKEEERRGEERRGEKKTPKWLIPLTWVGS